jgi:hypothetical protein
MNPLSWRREHRISWLAFSVAGALIGVLLAWLDSPYRRLCQSTISGERADCAQMLSLWLTHPSQYWQMAALCAVIPAVAFYGFQLMRRAA